MPAQVEQLPGQLSAIDLSQVNAGMAEQAAEQLLLRAEIRALGNVIMVQNDALLKQEQAMKEATEHLKRLKVVP